MQNRKPSLWMSTCALVALSACTGDDVALNSPAFDLNFAQGAAEAEVTSSSPSGPYFAGFVSFDGAITGPYQAVVEGVRIDPVTGRRLGNGVPWISKPDPRDLALAYGSQDDELLAASVTVEVIDLVRVATIVGQRIAADGLEVGEDDFVIATPAPQSFEISEPRIAYAPTTNEFLVVWREQTDVVGQRVAARTGDLVGPVTLLASGVDDGPNSGFDIVYSSSADEYLLVTAVRPELRAQRLTTSAEANGAPTVVGDGGFIGIPRAVYEPGLDLYALVWGGTSETVVQFLDGATAAEVGPDDLLVSADHDHGDLAFNAGGELVIALERKSPLTNAVNDILFQRIDPIDGSSLCPSPVVVSDQDEAGLTLHSGEDPKVAAGSDGSFLMVWDTVEWIGGPGGFVDLNVNSDLSQPTCQDVGEP